MTRNRVKIRDKRTGELMTAKDWIIKYKNRKDYVSEVQLQINCNTGLTFMYYHGEHYSLHVENFEYAIETINLPENKKLARE